MHEGIKTTLFYNGPKPDIKYFFDNVTDPKSIAATRKYLIIITLKNNA